MIDDILFFSGLGLFLFFVMYGLHTFQNWIDPPKTYRQIAEEHPEDCFCWLCEMVEIPKKIDALLDHPDSCACKYCIVNLLGEIKDELQKQNES